MTDMSREPDRGPAVDYARSYAAACEDLLNAVNTCAETANRVVAARNMAERRPQHEISIRNFLKAAAEYEADFVPLYKEFIARCAAARKAAADLRASSTSHDPEFVLLHVVDHGSYLEAGRATHILRTSFGPTPSAFIEGLHVANAAIQADIFTYGEDGFLGHVYSSPTTAKPAGPDEEGRSLGERLVAICRKHVQGVYVNQWGTVVLPTTVTPVHCKVQWLAQSPLIEITSPILLDVSPPPDFYQLLCVMQVSQPFGGLAVAQGEQVDQIMIMMRGHVFADPLNEANLLTAVSALHDLAVQHIQEFERISPPLGGLRAQSQ